jgi:hypothetical protein
MIEANENAIKGTPLYDLVKQAQEVAELSQGSIHLTPNESRLHKRVDELEEELAAAKQDLQDAQDRLFHVEPVFSLAKDMYFHQNPYLQGAKQAEICEYFRSRGYKDYFQENGL